MASGTEAMAERKLACPDCGEPEHAGLCLNAPDNPEGDLVTFPDPAPPRKPTYAEFLASKAVTAPVAGFEVHPEAINPKLRGPEFGFQGDIVRWALRGGRRAVWADTGLGKTGIQLEWARHVCEKWRLLAAGVPRSLLGPIESAIPLTDYIEPMALILAPLGVVGQTHHNGIDKFGIPSTVARKQSDCKPGINITNYDNLHNFDPAAFIGVVLDESSILKSFDGKTKTKLCEAFRDTPYKLCCTATPSPNDVVELGNHAEFLGIMEQRIMLTRWFMHDSGDLSWRLKKHATKDFWRWVASWAVSVDSPEALGYAAGKFKLPPLEIIHHIVDVSDLPPGEDKHGQQQMFRGASLSATNMHSEMRITAERRAQKVHDIVTAPVERIWRCAQCETPREAKRGKTGKLLGKCAACGAKAVVPSTPEADPWLIWVNTDYEAEAVSALLNLVEVRGPDKPEEKERMLMGFSNGEFPILMAKPSAHGFGMNWQHCANVVFMGLSYSYEQFYQAIRRCWRFGQTRKVTAHIVAAESEGSVLAAIQRKEAEHLKMKKEMNEAMRESQLENLYGPNLYGPRRKEAGPAVAMTVPEWLR